MFQIISEIWKKYNFQIIIGICIFLFILFLIFRKKLNQINTNPELTLLNTNNFKFKPTNVIPKKNENRCRQIFEEIFKKPFPNVRPEFLRRLNKNNKFIKLELDGYNPQLKLAWEYNGIQHYKYTPKFHKSQQDFIDQLQRDKEKKELCKINGIILIEIPYTINYDNLEQYIRQQLNNYYFSR